MQKRVRLSKASQPKESILVGNVEIVTDPDVKKYVWHDEMYGEHFKQGVETPDFAVLRFITRRYNLWVDMGDELAGSFDKVESNGTADMN